MTLSGRAISRHAWSRALLAVVIAAAWVIAFAKDAAPAASDPALEERMLLIAAELRCLVCQNQTIADSHAGLAEDLREEIRKQLRAGRSDDEVRRYMTDRYGDFVLYRPPLKATTALLWFGPFALLALGAWMLVARLRQRARLPDDRFELDGEAEEAAP
jgi:cytochrome c-type biogenesis protein CcmH